MRSKTLSLPCQVILDVLRNNILTIRDLKKSTHQRYAEVEGIGGILKMVVTTARVRSSLFLAERKKLFQSGKATTSLKMISTSKTKVATSAAISMNRPWLWGMRLCREAWMPVSAMTKAIQNSSVWRKQLRNQERRCLVGSVSSVCRLCFSRWCRGAWAENALCFVSLTMVSKV